MISCLVLERPGKWRPAALAAILALVILPTLPLLITAAATPDPDTSFVDKAFVQALMKGAIVAGAVGVLAFVVGLVLGLLAGLYDFPGRGLLLALSSLPLVVPSFLLAIGWSHFAYYLGPAIQECLVGYPGCVLVFGVSTIPLVMWVTLAATRGITASQLEAARLSGGDGLVLKLAARFVLAPAALAAALAAVVTLADPGAGQILDLWTAASEILTSFSLAPFHDYRPVARQCLVLAGVVLLLMIPGTMGTARSFTSQMLARQIRGPDLRQSRRVALVAITIFLVFLLFGCVMPAIGLLMPLIQANFSAEVGSVLNRTAGNTLLYAFGSAVIAVLLGQLLAFSVGRSGRLRMIAVSLLVVLFSLPPALSAVGLVSVIPEAPAWMDFLFRGPMLLCLAQGIHFFPLAGILALRAWGSMPDSWAQAAAVHGLSVGRYFWSVMMVYLLPCVGVSLLLVALLATADIGTVLLLAPAGEQTYPLAVFTIMANSPKVLRASLCLVYFLGAGGFLLLIWLLCRRWSA